MKSSQWIDGQLTRIGVAIKKHYEEGNGKLLYYYIPRTTLAKNNTNIVHNGVKEVKSTGDTSLSEKEKHVQQVSTDRLSSDIYYEQK